MSNRLDHTLYLVDTHSTLLLLTNLDVQLGSGTRLRWMSNNGAPLLLGSHSPLIWLVNVDG